MGLGDELKVKAEEENICLKLKQLSEKLSS